MVNALPRRSPNVASPVASFIASTRQLKPRNLFSRPGAFQLKPANEYLTRRVVFDGTAVKCANSWNFEKTNSAASGFSAMLN
jgi:hypothetical protein